MGRALQQSKNTSLASNPKSFKFTEKNVDYPFWVKKKVMECAMLSSVTYGCEAWIDGSIKAAQTMYLSMVKTLAGVRVSTTNNVVLAEL